jgi:hypothetical protein
MSRRIAIVGGTGPAGMGLALRWARAGEQVVIGSRDAKRAANAAAQITANAAKVEGEENAAAVEGADVVVLTVPFPAHATTLKQLKPAFRSGSVVIDTTVPLAATLGGRASRTLTLWEGSAAQQAAELVPEQVAVAAAFQNVSAEALAGDGPVECDVIVCSDDERALRVTSELAEKIPGVRAVNGGRLENARIVEQITALLIGINLRYKVHGAGIRITGLQR